MMHIIDDSSKIDVLMPVINGQRVSTGGIPRDPAMQGPGMVGAKPADLVPIPRGEWSARIKEAVATKSQLSDLRNRADNGKPFKSLDQNGQGYCWAYGTTAAVMLLRAKANQPYVRLSGHSVGCKVKNFRDEGGWGALSLDFIKQYGIAPVDAWPEKSMSRSNDRPETWAAAAKYRVSEDWMDLASPVYDRDLTFDQMATLLLQRVPVVVDLMWWAHCVVAMDLVEVESGSYGIRILNSWTDQWGDNGTSVIVGNRAIPDNAVAPCVAFGG
jgi:hypothetical protein